jgi:hypothetical protein
VVVLLERRLFEIHNIFTNAGYLIMHFVHGRCKQMAGTLQYNTSDNSQVKEFHTETHFRTYRILWETGSFS